jgi:hypothetical protein
VIGHRVTQRPPFSLTSTRRFSGVTAQPSSSGATRPKRFLRGYKQTNVADATLSVANGLGRVIMGNGIVALEPAGVDLINSNDTIVLRMALPVGNYIIIGKTVIRNVEATEQFASARLTTMDGHTELDSALVRITAKDAGVDGGQVISLQASLMLDAGSPDRIVDLRAQMQNGSAQETKLCAIQVDMVEIMPA